MSLRVHPDPREPAGGYAFLELPEGSLPEAAVPVAVFDAYGERWLSRPDQVEKDVRWQSEPVEFGPYEVYRHDGADWVRLGPEIVDRLEEYAPLRLTVAGCSHDVTWPDNVPPRAGAAVLGALQPIGRKSEPQADQRIAMADLSPSVAAEPEVAPPLSDAPVDPELVTRRGSRFLVNLILTALVVAGVLIWYFWPAGEDVPQRVTSGDACTRDKLAATKGGHGAIIAAIRACGVDVQPDTALSLVEAGAAAEDAEALLLFGTLYDGESLDPRIENLTGLTFKDDPAKAAEYYARAVKAGSTEAGTRLGDICNRLASADATLSKGAYDDYCS
jgi:hypothetical protein